MSATSWFAILPYLYTSQAIVVRDVEFRSALDTSQLSEAGRDELATLVRLFFLRADKRISPERITFACLSIEADVAARDEWWRRLGEARDLLGYMYAEPDVTGGPFIPFDQADLHIFVRADESLIGDGTLRPFIYPNFGVEGATAGINRDRPTAVELDRFGAWRNFESGHFVTTESRVYPRVPNLILHESQDMAQDVPEFLNRPENWALRPFMLGESEPTLALKERVGTGIRWYNLACRKERRTESSISRSFSARAINLSSLSINDLVGRTDCEAEQTRR